MAEAWASGGAPAALGGAGGTVIVLEGSTFCQSANTGDVVAGGPHGLFVSDTRVISEWRLSVDGVALDSLTCFADAPFAATFVGRVPPSDGHADSTMLVLRRRYIGGGMREDIVLRNLAAEAATVVVALHVGADFADLFEVKESRVRPRTDITADVTADSLSYTASGDADAVRVTAIGKPEITVRTITFRVVVPARSEWSTCVTVEADVGGRQVVPHHRCGQEIDSATAAQRMREWRLAIPTVTSADPDLNSTIRISAQDLGALQIHDPESPERRAVAAGAPWFMALFGRDSLLTSWMALALDQQLALGTLQTLARVQGQVENPDTEEQPGRIVHEMRWGREAGLVLGGGHAYYGSADATPLFVALLGELHRWGLPGVEMEALLPAADRALEWIETFGDADGDGFVEYHRATDKGLLNQGWKDSFDGISDAAGRMGRTPIALAEVQAYVYAAYLARACIAISMGDQGTAAAYRNRAVALKAEFNERFWVPDRKWFAVGLDADKRQLDSLTSNLGHCLWCGIVDDDKAPQVARASAGTIDVDRLRGAHAGQHHGCLQPNELSQRLRLAARQRDHRRRADALRLRGRGPTGRVGRARCREGIRRPAA